MLIPLSSREPDARRRFPVVTLSIVAINVIVFIHELGLSSISPAVLQSFIDTYAVIPARTAAHPLDPTLITSQFLHAGFAHIGFNMLFLLVFGDNVEDRLGRLRYLGFYLLSGVVASLVQVAVDPAGTVPCLGASGAIAGVLGAYLVFHPRGRIKSIAFFLIAFLIDLPAAFFIVVWFVTQLLNGAASLGVPTAAGEGVAYWAHVGGFAAGVLLALGWRAQTSRTHG